MQLVLCDAHVLLAESLSVLLAKRGHVVVARAASAEESLNLVERSEADAWLTDLQFGGAAALATIKRLRQAMPTKPIIILTAERDRGMLQGALEAGADAVALKTESIEEVERLLRRVASPAFQARRNLQEAEKAWSQLARSLDHGATKRRSRTELTPREREVLRRVCRGQRTEEIAESMSVGLSTVRTHMQHVYAKLDVHSRLELISYAARNNLVNDDESELDELRAA